MNANDVILRPVLSEKAVMQIQDGTYSFFVHPQANRTQIKDAIERVFEVDVRKINLIRVPRKTKRMGRFVGRTSLRKKAIVKLAPGQTIQQLEGLT